MNWWKSLNPDEKLGAIGGLLFAVCIVCGGLL